MDPRIGLCFFHRYWKDSSNNPLRYQVTAIRNGRIYIKAEGESKAKEVLDHARWSAVFGTAA